MSFVIEKTYHYGTFNGYRFDFRRKTKPTTTLPSCIKVDESDVIQHPSKCCHSDCLNMGRFSHSLKTNGWFCKRHIESSIKYYEFISPLKECDDKENECPICFDRIWCVSESMTTICRHVFHKRCLGKWFTNHNSCPICRETLHEDTYTYCSMEKQRTKLLVYNRVILSIILKKHECSLLDMSTTDDITKTERIIRALKKLDHYVLTEMYRNVTKQLPCE